MTRVKTGSCHYGWLNDILVNGVIVDTALPELPGHGEPYDLRLHGRPQDAILGCVLGTIEAGQPDVVPTAGLPFRLMFTLESPIRLEAAKEDSRFRFSLGDISIKGISKPAQAYDVSEHGLGIVCDHQFEVDDRIELSVNTAVGSVQMLAQVRHCNEATNGAFRVGLLILELPRLDAGRWRGLFAVA